MATDGKKYYVQLPGYNEGEFWDADKYERNANKLYSDHADAEVFTITDAYEGDGLETDQYMVYLPSTGEAQTWDAARWERNKDKIKADYPDVQAQRVRYHDYWYDQYQNYQQNLSNLQKEYDEAIDLPDTATFNPFPVDSPEYDKFEKEQEAWRTKDHVQADIDRLKLQHESNPYTVAERKARAEWEATYGQRLEDEIRSNMMSEVGDAERDQFAFMPTLHPLQAAQNAAKFATYDTQKDPKKAKNYAAALNYMELAKDMKNVEEKGFVMAMSDVAKKNLLQDVAQSEVATALSIGEIYKKLQDKYGNADVTAEQIEESLSSDEKALLLSFVYYSNVLNDSQELKSRGYRGGEIFAESLPFMAEFIATGGVAAATRKGLEGTAKGLVAFLEKYLGKAVTKAVSSATRVAVGELARTFVQPSTYKSMIVDANTKLGEDGRLHMGANAFKAIGDKYIENLSEASGGAINYIFGGAGKYLGAAAVSGNKWTKFGSWLFNNKGSQVFGELGWNGLLAEPFEELFGATLRDITRLDRNALEDFFDRDNLGAMLVGFAPMTLLGMGVSTASMVSVTNELDRQLASYRESFAVDFDEKQLTLLEKELMSAQDGNEVMEKLKPFIMALESQGKQDKIGQLLNLGMAVANYNTMFAATAQQADADRQAMFDSLNEKYGQFWMGEGDARQVRQVTMKDGSVLYSTAPTNENGEFSYIGKDGKIHFAKESDIAEVKDAQGVLSKDEVTMSLADFLNFQIFADKGMKERERMTRERAEQVAAVAQKLQEQNNIINLGTAEQPIEVAVQSSDATGVKYIDQSGQDANMTWEQVGERLGMPIEVLTDAQITEKEIASNAARMAERKMLRAEGKIIGAEEAENAAVEAAEEVKAANPKHIPMLPDGKVDEITFWNTDPEGYVEWNDSQRNDNGRDSFKQLLAAQKALQTDLTKAEKATESTDPMQRRASEAKVAEINERMARMQSLIDQYAERFLTPEQKRAKLEEEITARAAELSAQVGVEIQMVSDAAQISNPVAAEQFKKGKVFAFVQLGENPIVVMYLPNISSMEMLENKFVHEVAVHVGMRRALGEEGYNRFCEAVWQTMSETAKRHFLNYPNTKGSPIKAADEYIAHLAEKMGSSVLDLADFDMDRARQELNGEEQSAWQKIWQSAKEFFGRIFGKAAETLQEVDILNAVRYSYANLIDQEQRKVAAQAVLDNLSSLSDEQLAEVLQNDLVAAQAEYDNVKSQAPRVERGETSDSFLARQQAYNDAIAAAEATLQAKQDVVDLYESKKRAEEKRKAEEARKKAQEAAASPVVQNEKAQAEAMTDKDGNPTTERKPGGEIMASMETFETWTDNLGHEHKGTKEMVLERMQQQGFSEDEIVAMEMKMQTAYEYMDKLRTLVNPDGSIRFQEFNAWAEKTPLYKQVGRDFVKAISSLVSNGDYPINLELTTDCIKREAFTQLLNSLVAKGAVLRNMGPGEIATIQKIMKQYGIQVACALCFVEGKRLQIVNWATQIVDDWNDALVEAGVQTDEMFEFGKDGDAFIPTDEWRTYEDKPRLQKMLRTLDEVGRLFQGIDPETYKEQRLKNAQEAKKYIENKAAKDKVPVSKWVPNKKQEAELRKIKLKGLTPAIIDDNAKTYRATYEQMRNEWLDKNPGKDPLSFSPTQKQWGELEKIRNQEVVTVKQKMVRLIMEYPEMRKKMTMNDLLGSKGLMEIRQQHGAAYEQLYSIILQRFGSGTPKPVQDAVPYDGEVMTLTETAYKEANKVGGARLFSFSDFDITKVFDYMQMFFDLEANKQMLQSYTKEVAAVLLFGRSNAKFNISTLANAVVPAEVQEEYDSANEDRQKELAHKWAENAGLLVDENGYITGISFSDEHSVSPEFAKQIFHDDSRNKDCGAIMVGASVNHAIFSAAQDWIRMVIPFHLSGMPKAARDKTDVKWWTDNTEYQNTRKMVGGEWKKITSKEDTFEFYADMHQEGWNMRDKAREYLEWCKKQGFRPKFDWGINSDYYRAYCEENGYTPNQQIIDMMDAQTTDGVWDQYYKFLTDFTAYKPVFNEDGEMIDEIPSPQQRVVSNFDMSELEREVLFEGENSMLARREKNIALADKYMDEIANQVVPFLNGEITEEEMGLRDDVYFDSKQDAEAYLDALENTRLSAEGILEQMQNNAEVLVPRQLSEEIWENEIKGKLFASPMGDVKLGENQYEKYIKNGREKEFGMLLPTIMRPDLIFEEESFEEGAERQSKYAFVKTFYDEAGEKHINYASISVLKDGMEVVMSNHRLRDAQVLNKIKKEHLLWNRFASDSQSSAQGISKDQSNALGKDTNNSYTTSGSQGNTLFSAITPEQDAAYMEAVKSGDMETAQRMVNEAAKLAMPNTKVVDENGNPKVVYHGSPWHGFTVFESGNGPGTAIYFADKEVFAEEFRDKHTGEEDWFADLGYPLTPGVYGVFLNVQNPAVLGDLGLPNDEHIAEVLGESVEKIKSFAGVGYEKLDFEKGFSDLLRSKGYDGVYGYELDSYERGAQWAVWEPSQIKSAEPVTYDDAGNVIPLSERFNPEQSDIRFSIGNARKEQMREGMRTKLTVLSEQDIENTINEIEKLGEASKKGGDSKIEKIAYHWVLKGSVILPEDNYKIEEAIKVAEKAKVNPIDYNSPMELILTYKEFKSKDVATDPDTVKEFSNKTELENGITVYDVQDDFDGQAAVRKVIDTHWGEDANPWCLAARKDGSMEKAQEYWNHYNRYPKRIAFKDGKLLAFFASNRKKTWWDRMDEPHDGIPYAEKSKEGSFDVTTTYELKENGRKPKVTSIEKTDGNGKSLFIKDGSLKNAAIKEGEREVVYQTFLAGATLSEKEQKGDAIYIHYGPHNNLLRISDYERSDEKYRYVHVDYNGNGEVTRISSNWETGRGFEVRYGYNGDVVNTEGNITLRFDLDGNLTMLVDNAYSFVRNGEGYKVNRGRNELGFVEKGEIPSQRLVETFGIDEVIVSRMLNFLNENGWERADYPFANPVDADLVRNDARVREKVRKAENEINDLVGKKALSSVGEVRFSAAFESANNELATSGISINNEALMKEYGLSDITLTKKGNYVTLSKVVVDDKNKGNGTRFMSDLVENADENGWTLALTPDDSFGASSVARLKKFYKRFGFKENKGRSADFNTREGMVRAPESEVRFSAEVEPHKSSLEEITDMFYANNTHAELLPLFEKARKFCEKVGLEVEFVRPEDVGNVNGMQAGGISDGRVIKLNAQVFSWAPSDWKARAILHEMLHSGTMYVLVQNDSTLSPDLMFAKRELEQIYEEIKNRYPEDYGSTNLYEMIAELANPTFREHLKKGNLWQRLLNAIRKIFGVEEKDYNRLDWALSATERVLDNADLGLFNAVEEQKRLQSANAELLFSALPTKNDFEVEMKAMRAISMMHGFVPFDEMGNTFRSLINERETMVKRLSSKANKTAYDNERLARLEQDLEAAYRQLEWWENVQADLVPTEEVQPEVSKDMEPQSFEEYLSRLFTMSKTKTETKTIVDEAGNKKTIRLGGKKTGVMLTPETLTSEMGWKSGDWAGIRYIVSAKEGMTLDAIAEMIAEDEDAKQFLGNMDTMDIKNAVIDFLQSVGTYAEIRDYVKHQREAAAQEEANFVNAQIQYNAQRIEEETGMSVDEYNAMVIEDAFKAAEENLTLLESSEINGNFENLTEEEYADHIESLVRAEQDRVYEGNEDFEGEQSRHVLPDNEWSSENDEERIDDDIQRGDSSSKGDRGGEAGGVGQPPIGHSKPRVVSDRLETEGLSVEEIVETGKQKVAAENADAADVLMAKLRKINESLTSLRSALAAQREYDQNTVKILTSLANDLLEGGKLTDMGRGEIKRLLSVIKDAVGKKDLSAVVDRMMDIMIGNQLRFAENRFADLLKIKASKVNANGVEAQGKLDVQGQEVMRALKDGLKAKEEVLNEWIAEAENDLDSDSETIRHNAELKLLGYELAQQYNEDITASESEEAALREDLEKEENVGQLTKEQLKEYRKTIDNAIRENKMERVNAYESLLERLSSLLAGSMSRAASFREAEKQRVENIHHMANSDMQGMPADEHNKKDSWFWNNTVTRFLMKPLATFDQMLRAFAPKSRSGEGYLWNHFMGGWLKATENEYKGVQDAHERLDAYVRYHFGVKRWSDLFTLDRTLPKAEVTWWNAGKMETFEVSQGNLLYIYMVNKMADGRMKLRKMGITESDVDNIIRSIDTRFLDLADWIQSEFLPSLREKYNAVHERLFGAPMAAIENYFPIRVLENALSKNEDIGNAMGEVKPSTITGNIIKRTKNSKPLDILGSNAFDVVLGHVEEMEKWAAFSEWIKDLNTLLSYNKFRNRVKNMSGIYGAGDVVWKNFRSAAEIAAGVYQPASKVDSLDKLALNMAKGVTGAKISFRVYTAMKQLLSWPAFISDARTDILAKNMANPFKAWRWSMENLPLFEKRWKSRQAGDSRLMETDSDWKVWKNKVVELAGRVGMTPNAFVDAVTVAIGARSIYETRLKQYLDYGYSQEAAEEKAKRDATVLFNESQQSNEGAFLSQVQVDRTVTSVVVSLFRNSSMGYQRMYVDALRNIGRQMKPGYKAESIEYMTKQMVRDGLTPEQAERAAKRIYNRSFAKNAMRALTFGFVVQFAWNLGAYLVYLTMGDDDDKKKEMLEDAAMRALVGGPLEGLAFGNVLSNVAGNIALGESLSKVSGVQLPAISDLENIKKLWENERYRAYNELFNIVVQAGIGVNPQTITDAVVAIIDACDGDLETGTEAALCLMRILQVPQSQLENLYLDEIDFKADEVYNMTVEQFAERYAKYKVMRQSGPFTPLYSDYEEKKREDKYIKQFTQRAKEERLQRGSEEAKAWYQYVEGDEFQSAEEAWETLNRTKRNAKMGEATKADLKAAAQQVENLPQDVQEKRAIVKGIEKINNKLEDYGAMMTDKEKAKAEAERDKYWNQLMDMFNSPELKRSVVE